MNIQVRYVVIQDPSTIFGSVGRCGGGYNTVWRDWSPEGRVKREAIMREFEQGINEINGHYDRLEKSIREKGMLNPLVITCGRPFNRKHFNLPPEMRSVPASKLLIAESITGGSRLWIAQKLGIPIPCIINDRTGFYRHAPEIRNSEEALQYFKSAPCGLQYSPATGIKEIGKKIVEADHLDPMWFDSDKVTRLRGPMWINIMTRYGYTVELSPAVKRLIGMA